LESAKIGHHLDGKRSIALIISQLADRDYVVTTRETLLKGAKVLEKTKLYLEEACGVYLPDPGQVFPHAAERENYADVASIFRGFQGGLGQLVAIEA